MIQNVPVAAKFHCRRDLQYLELPLDYLRVFRIGEQSGHHRIASIDVSGRDGRMLRCHLVVG